MAKLHHRSGSGIILLLKLDKVAAPPSWRCPPLGAAKQGDMHAMSKRMSPNHQLTARLHTWQPTVRFMPCPFCFLLPTILLHDRPNVIGTLYCRHSVPNAADSASYAYERRAGHHGTAAQSGFLTQKCAVRGELHKTRLLPKWREANLAPAPPRP